LVLVEQAGLEQPLITQMVAMVLGAAIHILERIAQQLGELVVHKVDIMQQEVLVEFQILVECLLEAMEQMGHQQRVQEHLQALPLLLVAAVVVAEVDLG